MAAPEQTDYASLTVQLLSVYLTGNPVSPKELPALVRETRTALSGDAAAPGVADAPAAELSDGNVADAAPAPAEVPVYQPAVSIEESLASPDVIISLIDGKPYRAMKQHLARHGLTPAEYRTRYGLPVDYPVVAPAYSELRRETAKRMGLGRRAAGSEAAQPTPEDGDAVTSVAVEATSDTVSAPASGAKHRKTSGRSKAAGGKAAKTGRAKGRPAKAKTEEAPASAEPADADASE